MFDEISPQFNRIEALEIPESLTAVGEYYLNFPQVNDEEVKKILNNFKRRE